MTRTAERAVDRRAERRGPSRGGSLFGTRRAKRRRLQPRLGPDSLYLRLEPRELIPLGIEKLLHRQQFASPGLPRHELARQCEIGPQRVDVALSRPLRDAPKHELEVDAQLVPRVCRDAGLLEHQLRLEQAGEIGRPQAMAVPLDPRLLEQARELAASAAERYDGNKYVMGAYCEVGVHAFKVSGTHTIFDEAMSVLRKAETRLGDPDITKMVVRFERRLSAQEISVTESEPDEIVEA